MNRGACSVLLAVTFVLIARHPAMAVWPSAACASDRGDLNCDGAVNLSDLAILSQHWLENP